MNTEDRVSAIESAVASLSRSQKTDGFNGCYKPAHFLTSLDTLIETTKNDLFLYGIQVRPQTTTYAEAGTLQVMRLVSDIFDQIRINIAGPLDADSGLYNDGFMLIVSSEDMSEPLLEYIKKLSTEYSGYKSIIILAVCVQIIQNDSLAAVLGRLEHGFTSINKSTTHLCRITPA